MILKKYYIIPIIWTQLKRKEQERLETRKYNLQNDLMDRTITTEVRWCLQGKSECESGSEEKR
jgi:hypothetical protein